VAQSNPPVPREEYATPEQVASVAVFLARPESSHVNGVALPVDNGWLAI
jgi:NAD(P)-dependent dehydrogenase (short-subunit alcohol dehydrogenase family)